MKEFGLSQDQVEAIEQTLKKYGIESSGLLSELTDHYAEQIEEEINSGKTFEKAYSEFVENNSWLKLRKLQHAYWKYSERSIQKYVLRLITELYASPRAVLLFATLLGLYYLLSTRGPLTNAIFTGIHILFILQTLYIFFVSTFRLRTYKSKELTLTSSMCVSVFYALFFSIWTNSFWSDSETLFFPVFTGDYALYLNFGYYVLLFHLVYIHYFLFERAMGTASKRVSSD